jgi:hypothetical protein
MQPITSEIGAVETAIQNEIKFTSKTLIEYGNIQNSIEA